MPALGSAARIGCEGAWTGFKDKRHGMNATYGIGDIGTAAFSVFFMQKPVVPGASAASWRKATATPTAPTLSVSPKSLRTTTSATCSIRPRQRLRPVFAETIEQLGQIDGGLDEGVPPARWRARADRAGWQRVSLFAEDPLPALLDAGQGQWRDGVFPQHAGGHAGGTLGADRRKVWGSGGNLCLWMRVCTVGCVESLSIA